MSFGDVLAESVELHASVVNVSSWFVEIVLVRLKVGVVELGVELKLTHVVGRSDVLRDDGNGNGGMLRFSTEKVQQLVRERHQNVQKSSALLPLDLGLGVVVSVIGDGLKFVNFGVRKSGDVRSVFWLVERVENVRFFRIGIFVGNSEVVRVAQVSSVGKLLVEEQPILKIAAVRA